MSECCSDPINVPVPTLVFEILSVVKIKSNNFQKLSSKIWRIRPSFSVYFFLPIPHYAGATSSLFAVQFSLGYMAKSKYRLPKSIGLLAIFFFFFCRIRYFSITRRCQIDRHNMWGTRVFRGNFVVIGPVIRRGTYR